MEGPVVSRMGCGYCLPTFFSGKVDLKGTEIYGHGASYTQAVMAFTLCGYLSGQVGTGS